MEDLLPPERAELLGPATGVGPAVDLDLDPELLAAAVPPSPPDRPVNLD